MLTGATPALSHTTLRRCNFETQLRPNCAPGAAFLIKTMENTMIKLIATAGIATLLTGCVVAPDAGYG